MRSNFSFFESSEESLPSKREAETLAQLGKEFDLTYNVHLPTDISLTESDPRERWRAVEAIRYIIDITSPLSPSTYTLHLPDEHNFRTKADLEQWQETAYKNMEHLLSEVEALTADPSLLSVETLKYPFEWVGKIITDFSLSVCMDIGHLILCGSDVEAVFRQYSEVIPVIHLHGVENGRDHVALDRLSEKQTALVMSILKRFRGVCHWRSFLMNA